MIQRNDIHGHGHAPQDVQDFLLSFGDVNPYGEPLFRLVLAQNVFTQEAGDEIVEWDESYSLAERGGMSQGVNQFGEPVQFASGKRPRKTTRGMRWVPRYPKDVRGWVLERWFPELTSRVDWCAPGNCMKDGTPLLGPYPEHGEYKLVAGPCGEVPSPSELEQLIEQVRYNINLQLSRRNEANWKRVQRMQVRIAQEAVNDLAKTLRKQALIKDQMSFMNGTTLEAGRLREQYAQAIRNRGGEIGHVGN